jgi:hypothetical protein
VHVAAGAGLRSSVVDDGMFQPAASSIPRRITRVHRAAVVGIATARLLHRTDGCGFAGAPLVMAPIGNTFTGEHWRAR